VQFHRSSFAGDAFDDARAGVLAGLLLRGIPPVSIADVAASPTI